LLVIFISAACEAHLQVAEYNILLASIHLSVLKQQYEIKTKLKYSEFIYTQYILSKEI